MLFLLADGEAPAQPEQSPLLTYLPIIVMVLVFYFILLRPQQKEQRRRAEMLAALKKNDKVVTSGGIIGTVVEVSADNQRVTLKVDDNTRIKVLRSRIEGVYEEKAEADSAKKS
ncbi:MAG: preprotein translocase subunit YajC [Planctomycetaceae bacterium]|nr:preprotein translocase subunit YajC [Planctomycetaceae bacterium]